MRIAIVEDNRALARALAGSFEADGHGVDVLRDGQAALDHLMVEAIDAALIDINLPGLSGIEVLRALRLNGRSMPVLLLTARDDTADKIAGLDAGADDYLTKPFDLDELKARVRAMLRRGSEARDERIAVGNTVFDGATRSLSVDDIVVPLSRRELALAEVLFRHAGRVVSKDRIITHVYGAGAAVEDAAAELIVHRLRKRLASASARIETLRGLGYCLRVPS